ncbi:MAG: MFS transporter [Candidatus Accumulibacter sp.]|jgi:PAT family beta-lactamase induction signal transducer AmpG|nr:MFS transporter [Accumulibacter sp.]
MPDFRRSHRLAAVLLLGFASGLPLALTGQAMQAWLTTDGIDFATIGFFGLIGIPYTFKFLWAPLMDRFEPPWLGRRRGWLVLTQGALALILFALSGLSPGEEPRLFAQWAVLLAFLSASQDVVVDAYRADVLADKSEHGLGASLHVFGYRLAMIVSGGIALIWADQWRSWPKVYALMGGIMAGAALISLFLLPPVRGEPRPRPSSAGGELRGFLSMLAGVGAGYLLARNALVLIGLDPHGADRWIRLLFVMAEILAAVPLAWWFARLARFETLNASLTAYFAQPGAVPFLALIVLYKLGDAFAGSLTTAFLIKGLEFSQAEVGIANKIIGIWLTIIGALIGGTLMLRVRLYRALLFFGILQLLSNFGFYLIAVFGKGAWGGITVPPFDWLVVSLREATSLDFLLLAVVAGENLTGGMGTVALVALLMALCNSRFTATHYALLSALAAVGRIYVGPVAGVLTESVGWPAFYLFSVAVAVPGIVMVRRMRAPLLMIQGTEPQRAEA